MKKKKVVEEKAKRRLVRGKDFTGWAIWDSLNNEFILDCGPEGKLFDPRRTFLQRLLSNSWKGGKAMSDGTTYYQCEVCGIGVMNYREPCNVCAKIAQARAEAEAECARRNSSSNPKEKV